jgi:diguanylate cyclase (GGDEF)-like protein
MRVISEKFRLLSLLGIVLIAGFLAVSSISYLEARRTLGKRIAEQTLPATGDAISLEIQKEVLRPVLIGSMMANDVFVRDWMANGESAPEQIMRYLKEVVQKHGAAGGFLASERTRQYYGADGNIRPLQQTDSRDGWFFRVRDIRESHQTDTIIDPINRDLANITVYHRILDGGGNFLGVAGVTVAVDTLSRLVEGYQARSGRSVYFVDPQGAIVLAGKSGSSAAATLQARPGMREVAAQALNGGSKITALDYRLSGETILVNSRFISELKWHLVIEENLTRPMQPIRAALLMGLGIGAIVIMLALAIVLFTTSRDQKRMERMASIDPLTGLLNRQAFEIVLEQSMLDVKRSGHPISAILFDIDSFQQVNDKHGHLAGDQVLRTIAQLARRVVRDNDIITRWSGTEFLILLRECPLEIAVGVAEKLRHAIASQDFGLSSPPQSITTSLGVAQFGFQESQISFFIRTDKALRDAKAAGKNRTIASVMENQDENIAAAIARRG